MQRGFFNIGYVHESLLSAASIWLQQKTHRCSEILTRMCISFIKLKIGFMNEILILLLCSFLNYIIAIWFICIRFGVLLTLNIMIRLRHLPYRESQKCSTLKHSHTKSQNNKWNKNKKEIWKKWTKQQKINIQTTWIFKRYIISYIRKCSTKFPNIRCIRIIFRQPKKSGSTRKIIETLNGCMTYNFRLTTFRS